MFHRDTDRVGHRLASSAILLWATTMLLRVFQLVTTVILARLLTPSDYGLVAIATMVSGFLDVLSNIQVGGAIIKAKDLTKEHLDTAFTLSLLRGAFTALVLVLLAGPTSNYMHDQRLRQILYVLAIPAFLGGIHNSHFLLFARNLNFRQDSKRDALSTAIGSLVAIGAAIIFRSYWALIAGTVTTSFTKMVISYWGVPGRPGYSLKKTGELLSYGSWLLLVSMLDYANSRVDFLLIGRGIGSSALGAYQVGQQITMTATGDLVSSLSRPLFSAFSIMSGDVSRLRTGYRQIQSITILIALPIGFGLSAIAEDLIPLLLGKKWALAVPVIAFLAPLIALQTLSASIESLALSLGKGRLLFIRTFIFFIFRVSVMLIGFYWGGFIGIVYARLISGSFFLLYGLALAARLTESKMIDPVKASWRSFVSVALMWCVVKLVQYPGYLTLTEFQMAVVVVAKVLIGGITYAGAHLILWKMTGRPDGAERRLIEYGTRFGHLLKRKAA